MTAQQAIQPVTDSIRKVTDQVKAQVAKPDHPTWRKLANWAVCIGGPTGLLLINIFVPEKYKKLAEGILIGFMSILKSGSKLTEKK